MVSWFDTWITFRVNLSVLILFIFFAGALIIISILAIQRKCRHLQSIAQHIEQLSSEVESAKQQTSTRATSQDAYLQFIS